MENLKQFGVVPIDYGTLRSIYSGYNFPRNKIAMLEEENKLIRLKKGVFVVAPTVSKELLSEELIANHLYGPSYVSMESALRYHGLIPEQVYTVRSMTTNRSKRFENSIAYFDYVFVAAPYYSIGITQQTVQDKYTFLIATPEKALCDLIITTPRLRIQSVGAMETYLEEDLRLNMPALDNMNGDIIRECIEVGKKKPILKLLLKLIKS